MNCKKCNGEIDQKAVVCVHCGCKIKKPFYKKWWLWAIIIIVIAAIAGSGNNENDKEAASNNNSTAQSAQTEITYEAADLGVMIEELEGNALKAEKNYQDKNIEFTAKIAGFDSDGNYINVEPVNADEWNFITAMCYIKNKTQEDFLLEKNVGDTVTIKGKVTSVGEVLGYSIDIKEIY